MWLPCWGCVCTSQLQARGGGEQNPEFRKDPALHTACITQHAAGEPANCLQPPVPASGASVTAMSCDAAHADSMQGYSKQPSLVPCILYVVHCKCMAGRSSRAAPQWPLEMPCEPRQLAGPALYTLTRSSQAVPALDDGAWMMMRAAVARCCFHAAISCRMSSARAACPPSSHQMAS